MTQCTRPAVTFAILMTASSSLAQPADESDDRQSPSYEVGAGIAPWFLSYVDVEATRPPSVWATIPAGRFRVQIDYLRSVRGQPLWYAGYAHTDDHGWNVEYQVARMSHHVEQMFSAAVKWPWRRLGRRGYLLFGGAWHYYTKRWCVAINVGDRPEHGTRLDWRRLFLFSSPPGGAGLA